MVLLVVESPYCSKFLVKLVIFGLIASHARETDSFKISLDDVYDINLSDERLVVLDPETETTTIFYESEFDDGDGVAAIIESGTEESVGTTSNPILAVANTSSIGSNGPEVYAAPVKAPTSKPPQASTSSGTESQCACGIPGTVPNGGIRGSGNEPEIEPIVNLGVEKVEKEERQLPIRPLIIGGNPSISGEEFPWMTVIAKKRLYDNNWKIICGGSVINRKYILTAAHCIAKQSPNSLELWLRAYNTSNIKSNPNIIRLKARKLIPHPQWDEKTVSNDIGLIELNTPILFSETMNPVCLPKGTEQGDFSGQNGTVVGFGFTRPHGAMAKILQKLVIPILSHEECTKTKYGSIVGNNPKFLCAGVDEGGKDACTNDSGGPFTVIEKGKHKLVGIVSWGHGCAQPGLPGVYTRVTSYTKWIESVINKDSSIKKRKC